MPSNTSPSKRLSRRELLRSGSTVAVVLGAVGVSGCLESIPALSTNAEPIAVPAGDSPEYRSWLPAPSALPDQLSLDPGHVIAARPKTTEQEGLRGLFGFPELMVTSQVDWFGYDYGHYDRATMIDRAVVLEGAIDRSVVESAISETTYEPGEEYEGYDLFERSDVQRTLAVGDESIVFSSDEHSRANVEAVIDAGDGRIERYHETDADFERLLDTSGGRQFNWFTPTDGAFIEAISIAYDEANVYQITHRLYDDEDSFSEKELRREFESGGWEGDPKASSIQSDGRLATVVLQFDREKYLEAATEYDWPQVTWGVEHDEAERRVTIRHEAGDSIDASLLSISVRSGSQGREAKTQFADEYQTVEPGDDLVFDTTEWTDAKSVWLRYNPGGKTQSSLFHYDLE